MGCEAAYFVDLLTGEVGLTQNRPGDPLVYAVEPAEWLHAIADAAGLPRQPLARSPGYEHDIVVNLATGTSQAVHQDVVHEHGAPDGFRVLSEVEAFDFLDGLRGVRGLPPCDRAAMTADISDDFQL